MSWFSYKPYVSVAERRAKAAREAKALAKKGYIVRPVQIEGRAIARTFWGKAWCEHLESFSDFESRLPKGRTYVRNGSVCDLQIEKGRISAMICGSELYKIKIDIKPLPEKTLSNLKSECAGQIGSIIELLQGRLSDRIMQLITRRDGGLFPRPDEIQLKCSCPDWATMCKHVAAALYGVGARLDESPELLFLLRNVDHLELLSQDANVDALTNSAGGAKTIGNDELSSVFGIDMGDEVQQEHTASPIIEPRPASRKPERRLTKSRAVGKTKNKADTLPPAVRRKIAKPLPGTHARSKNGSSKLELPLKTDRRIKTTKSKRVS